MSRLMLTLLVIRATDIPFNKLFRIHISGSRRWLDTSSNDSPKRETRCSTFHVEREPRELRLLFSGGLPYKSSQLKLVVDQALEAIGTRLISSAMEAGSADSDLGKEEL
jgi:hypothetical protein